MIQAGGDQALGGEALIVPASAVEYIATDFAGFGEAIDRYRDLLRVHHEPVRPRRPPGA